jgi:hypothetical protein
MKNVLIVIKGYHCRINVFYNELGCGSNPNHSSLFAYRADLLYCNDPEGDESDLQLELDYNFFEYEEELNELIN